MIIPAKYLTSVLSDFTEVNNGVLTQNFENNTVSVKFPNLPQYCILMNADKRIGSCELNVKLLINLLQVARGYTAVLEGDFFTVRVATLSGRKPEEMHPSAIYFKISDDPDEQGPELRMLLLQGLKFEDEDDVPEAA